MEGLLNGESEHSSKGASEATIIWRIMNSDFVKRLSKHGMENVSELVEVYSDEDTSSLDSGPLVRNSIFQKMVRRKTE